jgi:hypothetical protein
MRATARTCAVVSANSNVMSPLLLCSLQRMGGTLDSTSTVPTPERFTGRPRRSGRSGSVHRETREIGRSGLIHREIREIRFNSQGDQGDQGTRPDSNAQGGQGDQGDRQRFQFTGRSGRSARRRRFNSQGDQGDQGRRRDSNAQGGQGDRETAVVQFTGRLGKSRRSAAVQFTGIAGIRGTRQRRLHRETSGDPHVDFDLEVRERGKVEPPTGSWKLVTHMSGTRFARLLCDRPDSFLLSLNSLCDLPTLPDLPELPV